MMLHSFVGLAADGLAGSRLPHHGLLLHVVRRLPHPGDGGAEVGRCGVLCALLGDWGQLQLVPVGDVSIELPSAVGAGRGYGAKY